MSTRKLPRNSLTLTDVSRDYGISERTLRRYIAEGVLPAYRLGPRLIRIDPDDVAALFERIPTTDPAA